VVVDLGLVLGRTEVVERAVNPLPIVENLDELEDRPANLSFGRPRLAVNEFFFERRKPALPNGVVPALAFAGKAL